MNGANATDEGSGTMAGMALVMLAATLLAVAAMAGHLVSRHAHVRGVADLAALSAATAAWHRNDDPCAVAARVAAANGAALVECAYDDALVSGAADAPGSSSADAAPTAVHGDVTVRVGVTTEVPFLKEVSVWARAGPVPCT